VRTGAMFLGFANELSGTHAAVFTRALTAWYRQHGVRLRGAVWGAPDHMDTRIVECSMKPEVRFGYREEAAADLLT
jgi:hypothetical protein